MLKFRQTKGVKDLKVLMLGWELPPHHVGGLGIVALQMCRQLARYGVDITYVLPFSAKFDHKFMNIVSTSPADSVTTFSTGGSYDSHLYTTVFKNGRVQTSSLYQQVDKFAADIPRIVKIAELM